MAKRKDPESRYRKRNIARYLLLLFASLAYALFYGGIFPYTFLYMMLALPVISALHMAIVCYFFRMSERVGERTFVKGECATYHLILQNTSFLYMPYITVHMQLEGQFILKNLRSAHLSLAPFSRREFKYRMPLYFRGRYDIGVNYIEIQDLLGLIKIRLNPFEKKSILVKPRILEQNSKSISAARLSEGEISAGLHETGHNEIKDIREYVYGDSFRKIHWKLTSKLSKPMVKDTRNELDNDIILLLNLNKSGPVNEETLIKEDCLIEEMVSTIYFLLSRNIPVKLCFFKEGPYTFRAASLNEFEGLYQILSEVKFSGDDDFESIYHYFTDTEQNCRLIYVFSVNLDGKMIEASHRIKNKGFDIELYYVDIVGISQDDAEAKNELADLLMKSNIRGYLLTPCVVEIPEEQEEPEKAWESEPVMAWPWKKKREKVNAHEKQA